MKICLVSNSPCVGDAELYLQSLTTGLIQARHNVSLICPQQDAWHALVQDLKMTGAEVIRLPIQSPQGHGRWPLLPGHKPKDIHLFRKAYLEIAPDVLHINTDGVEDGQTCVLAAKDTGIHPVLVTNHNGTFAPYHFAGIPVGLIDWIRKKSVRKIDPWVDVRIAVTLTTSATASQQYGIPLKKFRTVYTGIDLSRCQPQKNRQQTRAALALAPSDPVFICVSPLFKDNGLDFLLTAFGEIQRNHNHAHLLIVNKGPEKENLKTKIHALGLEENIHLTGWRDDIADLLSAADVFVLPSLNENFPLVLLEAMAAGLPVIATNVGGVPEIFRHQVEGVMLPAGDAAVLTWAMQQLIEEPDKARAMGRAAKTKVEKEFNTASMTEATLAVYEEFMSTGTYHRAPST